MGGEGSERVVLVLLLKAQQGQQKWPRLTTKSCNPKINSAYCFTAASCTGLGSHKTEGEEKGTRGRDQGTESQDRTPLAVLKSCALQRLSSYLSQGRKHPLLNGAWTSFPTAECGPEALGGHMPHCPLGESSQVPRGPWFKHRVVPPPLGLTSGPLKAGAAWAGAI